MCNNLCAHGLEATELASGSLGCLSMKPNEDKGAITEDNYACPSCKLPVLSKRNTLFCQQCGLGYPVESGIPNFITEDLSESKHPVLRSVSSIDKLARIYETWLWYPLVYHLYGGLFVPSVKKEVKMITEMVDADGGLGLDVACGTGLFTRSVARKMRYVYGVDISKGMLEKAVEYAEEKGIRNIRFARARAEKLPFPDNFFDGVICCGALHLFPNTKNVLDEIGRVMKKDARLAVMTFLTRGIFKFEWVRKHLERDHGVHVFDLKELDIHLLQTGFRDFTHAVHGSIILFHAKKA